MPEVVIVADAPPVPDRDAGLTLQTGNEVLVICTLGATVQVKVTGPTKPEPATMEMFVDAVPPGETASEERAEAVSVKS